jgi:hypothetical protein
MSDPTPEQIRATLAQLLAGEALSKSAANRRLLTYLVDRTLNGGEGPKEVEIAIDVFGRDAGFNGAEDSVVRVAIRSLRQKLLEHYSGPASQDPLIFDVPKGAYRVTVTPRVVPVAVTPAAPPPGIEKQDRDLAVFWRRAAVAAVLLLVAALAGNVWMWRNRPHEDNSELAQVRRSAVWAPFADSQRPLMFVLGDLFMYTQSDPATGRTQTVRDSRINSSEDLRAFLASNPALAADRGLRYSTMIQKSTAVGMVRLLQMLDAPGRSIEVRLRDELQAGDLRAFDIVYVGPITRLGPLASDNHLGGSRYRFDAASSSINDTKTGKVYAPEGELGAHHRDFALVSRFPGSAGKHIMVLTSGGRNAGLMEVVSTLTSAEGVKALQRAAGGTGLTQYFEALISVAGYKQTDLSAQIVEVHPLSVTP